MDKITNKGMRAITTSKERQEIRAIGKVLVLEYHHLSKEQGAPYNIDTALYDVISPRIPGYVSDVAKTTFCRESLLKYFPLETVDSAIKQAKTVHTGDVCKSLPCYQGAALRQTTNQTGGN